MDRRLQESVTKGDVLTFRKLIEQDQYLEIVRQQPVPGSLNTILHLAARFGHLEFAKEIVKSCPEMFSAENIELETPLHVACREGNLEIVKLLLETDPWIAYKVNCREETLFFAACERGQINVVKHLVINFAKVLMLEIDNMMMTSSSLHVAASSGYTVKEILKVRPDFAWKKDSHGRTPLHLACGKGHLDTTKELLKLDSDLCSMQDSEGRIPLHYAAIKGRIDVIHEMLCLNLESYQMKTYKGETILHLAVKNNQYEMVKFLVETLDSSKLLNLPDNEGNTILSLATAGKLTGMLTYLLRIGVEVNALNRKGYTALDVVEADATNSEALAIIPALLESGAKRRDQLSPGLVLESQQLSQHTSKILGNISYSPQYRSSPQNHHHHKQNQQRQKKIEPTKGEVRSARKTITIVAVLIATVTFTAGINPSGGFSQETGKALRGNRAAFKVFLVCNIISLFLSIGIVNVLVSIIPLTRKNMIKLLAATHKVMWISTLLMTAAYIAAIWTIMPEERGARWVTVGLTVFGGGCMVLVFFGLGVMWTRYLHNKHKLKKNNSSNSEVDSSDHGYHLF